MLCLAIISWGANAQHDHSKMSHSNDGHSKMDSKMNSKSTVQSTIQVEHSQSVTAIIDHYLALKDALVEDNSNKAAGSAKMLFDAFAKFDFKKQAKSQQKELGEIIEDASEHAEHISDNKGNIEHQREHFEILSIDLKDLVVITGSDRTLYQLFARCTTTTKAVCG